MKNTSQCICLICDEVVKNQGNTTNLLLHLKNRHSVQHTLMVSSRKRTGTRGKDTEAIKKGKISDHFEKNDDDARISISTEENDVSVVEPFTSNSSQTSTASVSVSDCISNMNALKSNIAELL